MCIEAFYKILKHFAFGGNSSIPSFHCGAKESPRAHFGERMDQTRTLFLPDKEICFLSVRIVYLFPSCYADRVLTRQKKTRSYSGTECLCVMVYQLKYALAGLYIVNTAIWNLSNSFKEKREQQKCSVKLQLPGQIFFVSQLQF